MTDINLLRDREMGDQSREDEEKQKRKAETLVTLTNPRKGNADTGTIQPATGFWASIKSFFERLFPAQKGVPGKVRILHEEVHTAGPEPKKPKPKKKITEEYAAAEGQLDDVFATPDEPAIEENQPEGQSSVSVDAPAVRQPGAWPAEEVHLTSESPDIASASVSAQSITPEASVPSQPNETVAASEQQSSLETSLGVNLVPEEMMAGSGKQNRVIALLFFAIFSILAVALLYVILSIFQQRIVSQIEQNQEQIAQREQQISQLSLQKRETVEFNKRMGEIFSLLDEHIYWTKFLAGLEKYTVDSVQYTTINADQARRLNLSARGKDFRTVARQLIAFEEADDFIETVSITSATSTEKDGIPYVEFSASITLVSDVFYRDSTGGPVYSIE